MSRHGDWLTLWWNESISSAVDTVNLELVGDPELSMYDDDLVVDRIIGQFYLANTTSGGTSQFFAARVYDTDFSGNTGAVITPNLWVLNDADQRFLWHKVMVLDGSGNAGAKNMFSSASHPEWSHVDIRVNRRLGDLRGLYWKFDALTVTASFDYGLWLRAWVRAK